MSADILGTSWDQCRSMFQCSFTSTETRRLVRTDSPGRPPRLSHSSWTMYRSVFYTAARHRPVAGRQRRTGEKGWGNSGPVTPASLHSSPATVTITKMLQVIAFSCRFWRKCNFACKRPKSKMKMLIVRCTRNQMSRNVHYRTRESFPVPTMTIC